MLDSFFQDFGNQGFSHNLNQRQCCVLEIVLDIVKVSTLFVYYEHTPEHCCDGDLGLYNSFQYDGYHNIIISTSQLMHHFMRDEEVSFCESGRVEMHF